MKDTAATPTAVQESPPASSATASSSGRRPGRRMRRARSSLFAAGEPMIWLTGGALAVCVVMIVGLLGLVLALGLKTFWPQPIVRVDTPDGRVYMGEVTRNESYAPDEGRLGALSPQLASAARAEMAAEGGHLSRQLMRTGNFRLTQKHFEWVNGYEVAKESRPEWAFLLEREEWGRFYGFPQAFVFVHDVVETKTAQGTPRAREDQLADVAARVDAFKPQFGGEARVLGEAFRDGRMREVLFDPAEAERAARLIGVAEVVTGPEKTWNLYQRFHGTARELRHKREGLEKHQTGDVNRVQEKARLAMRGRELALEKVAEKDGRESAAYAEAEGALETARQEYDRTRAWAEREFASIRYEIDAINQETDRYQIQMRTAGEGTLPAQSVLQPVADVVRAYPANRLTLADRAGIYLSRWGEFLSAEPREANSEGGVWPAIFGTVTMTLVMCIVVVPFGVLAALYLREYARAGAIVSFVRIAVNNLAGVPSIVFGVFGLGFFCYVIGVSIDQLFFQAHLPNPTYGKGGILWSALTLALLTLPVVIVATEEALAAVPRSMREGSYACGASKWQTIRRIVLPRAMPGIMTGMILAMARGAGEVAPLMLVGAVKLAPELPVDGVFPYIHPERSFMHLGFHIYDVGFQSQNSEAAKPMVFTTTLLLIGIVALLNLSGIWLRTRLRKRFVASHF